ncbi:MAG: DUF4864 domain-containing protein [Rhizobiaceae bacterium]
MKSSRPIVSRLMAAAFAAMLSLTAAPLAVPMFSVSASAEETVSPADTNATQSVIDSQIGAFRSGDDASAYAFAAPSIKTIFPTPERFIAMVKSGYQALYDPESYSFGRNTFLYGEVYQELIVTGRDGKLWQAVYTLKRQDDGSWKITGVKMNPYKGAST